MSDIVNAYSPTGKQITGQIDVIMGLAQVNGFTRDNKGKLDPEWEGYTEVDWNSQEPSPVQQGKFKGQRRFEDEDGCWWPEACISLEGEPLKPNPFKPKKNKPSTKG